ncbi:MAG: hypothetical protein GKR90_25295 [Pseudomonadales bacterium]|nr:hypothetical protein [Pseudomonadales bacterium]
MEGNRFKFGYKETQQRLQITRYTVAALATAVVLLSFFNFSTRERVIVTFPMMNGQYQIDYNSANKDYHKHYALYVSGLLGNVNPDNAAFTKEALSHAFSSALYNEIQVSITEDAEQMRMDSRSTRFYADKIIYEESSGRTFVTGKQEVISAVGSVTEKLISYEFQISIAEGIPRVERYSRYAGQAHTEDWQLKNRNRQVARQ